MKVAVVLPDADPPLYVSDVEDAEVQRRCCVNLGKYMQVAGAVVHVGAGSGFPPWGRGTLCTLCWQWVGT